MTNIYQDALWTSIESFPLTEAQGAISFEEKLAEENRWTLGYANLVTQEYRRFVYLTQVAGHMVCPSDDVDQAWHLHLTMTVSYQRMCALFSKGFLHHHASAGGQQELEKHIAMYEKSLVSYRRIFNSQPSASIWPDVQTRFNAKPLYASELQKTVRILFPFNAGLSIVPVALVMMLLIWAAPSPSIWPNITGPQFLFGYILILLSALLVPVLGQSHKKLTEKESSLDPYEVAFMEGGATRVLGTALTRLIDAKVLRLEASREAEKISGAICERIPGETPKEVSGLNLLERRLLATIPHGPFETAALEPVAQDLVAHSLERRLIAAGLTVESGRMTSVHAISASLLLLLIPLGLSRLLYGIQNYHPLVFLLLLLIATVGMFVYQMKKGQRLTTLGHHVLSHLKSIHTELKTNAAKLGAESSGQDQGSGNTTAPWVALGFALFGSQAVMADERFAGLNFVLGQDSPNNTGNSKNQAGCGGAGCGGGCGGCGG